MNRFKAHYTWLDGDEIIIVVTELNSHRAVLAAGRKLGKLVTNRSEWELNFITTVKE